MLIATEAEAALLTEGWEAPTTAECENCGGQAGQVWEIGGALVCSSGCALQWLPEVGDVGFEDYLWDLRLKASLLDIYDAVHSAAAH